MRPPFCRSVRGPFQLHDTPPRACERHRAQVDSDGRVLLRSAGGGGAEGRLVDLGTKLGPVGAGRLALLLQATAPAELVSLDLR